jgi:hypothetical protein
VFVPGTGRPVGWFPAHADERAQPAGVFMPADMNEWRLPSADDEAHFWALVEAAWTQCSAEANRVRRALAARATGPDADLSAVDGALPVFLGALVYQSMHCLAAS